MDLAPERSTSVPSCRSCGGRPTSIWRTVPGQFGLLLVVMAALWAWRSGRLDAPPTRAGVATITCSALDHEHRAWTNVLERYVTNGVVDYSGLATSGRESLDRYLRSLESVCQNDYAGWSRNQKLAFWINAYNAFTARLIVDHYPLRSIREIGVLPGAAFRERFIGLPGMRERPLSLSDVEHEILRREFREPRIHFAIVCASKSCPILRSSAYVAGDLDSQLDAAARSFVRDPARNRLDSGGRTLGLSSIFDWFSEDFERAAGSVPNFVARYATPEMAAAISDPDIEVEYLTYDWSLNGR